MKGLGGMRRALAGVAAASALALAFAGPAAANYDAGLEAYKKGQYEVAIDIWKRFAVAGDVRSKNVLGDVYSGKTLEGANGAKVPLEAVTVDNVEALKWYILAAHHDFTSYQRPTAEEVNARILAEHRLPDIRARMSTSDVNKAERLVSEIYERGSPYDLFRLGNMYQRGAGVSKNNSKALTMFSLAKARGVGEAAIAYENLEKLMTKGEIDSALQAANVWQPPLPFEHTGQTTQQKEMERLRRELEELRLQEALQAVADIDVELIQRSLRALGFYFGAIDNRMGPETRAAIRRYQYSTVARNSDMSEAQKDSTRTGVLTARQTVDLFRDAAQKADHPMSQYVLGIMHVRGIGVEQDGAKAVDWLEKASRADLAIAHYALGVIFRDGTTGLNEVTPDKARAARHFARSYALGYRPARDALQLLEFEAPPSRAGE